MDGREAGGALLERDDTGQRDSSGRGSTFAPLLREVRAAGLLAPRRGAYLWAVTVDALLLAAMVAAVAVVAPSWWVLLLAVPLTVVTVRFTYLVHDACHQQVAATRTGNRWIALLFGNLLCGMSRSWWSSKHNRHHANPNHIGKDPDVDVGALVWTQWQAAERQGGARWLTRNQARLFLPMLLLEGLALRVAGLTDLRNRQPRQRLLEGGLLVVHLAGYTALLLVAMPPLQALVFALVHHAVLGVYLGGVFAPNHKGMAQPEGEERWGHLERQVLTARNVRGGPVRTWFFGGLNYQIEHHLFPGMPRRNLRRVQPLVRSHCHTVGLPYVETGQLDSYRQALSHMHSVGEPLRAERRQRRKGTAPVAEASATPE